MIYWERKGPAPEGETEAVLEGPQTNKMIENREIP